MITFFNKKEWKEKTLDVRFFDFLNTRIVACLKNDILYGLGFSNGEKENSDALQKIKDRLPLGVAFSSVLPATHELQKKILSGTINVACFGSLLQQKVWQALGRIPQGQTFSYSDLAIQVGFPKAVRAVATAVGKNPVSFLVPCHRVVPKNGSSVGQYLWGQDLKKRLLDFEKTPMSR